MAVTRSGLPHWCRRPGRRSRTLTSVLPKAGDLTGPATGELESLLTGHRHPHCVRTERVSAPRRDSTQEVQILTGGITAAEYGRFVRRTDPGHDQDPGRYQIPRRRLRIPPYTALNANTWARNAKPSNGFHGTGSLQPVRIQHRRPFYIPNHFQYEQDQVFWYGQGMA